MKKVTILLLALSLLLLGAQIGCAKSNDDIEALRKDVQELKKGQAEIKKDINELKGLLQGAAQAKAAPPPPPTESVVSIDDDPFKGEKTAKLTIIEFSDYQ